VTGPTARDPPERVETAGITTLVSGARRVIPALSV
jgi:hypothetical protein